MPTTQAVWGIEIGQCALKAIRVRIDPETKKVEALAFDYIEHPKILSQPDADPDALSREAIQTFLSRNQVKGDRVCIGVPGQSGLARFIKLPPVEQSRIPEIVKYEARQQIPFALEEVVWDYQTIGKAEETEGFSLETEIGLFAMKRDLIYRFMNPFREAGIEVDVVQMRPLAVYNFAAFDQMGEEEAADSAAEGAPGREELVEKKAAAVDDDKPAFTVLLDMGADNSDLVITDGTRIWQRNVPIGGNHFTRALTKELKLTFAKAEHLKRNATKAQDPRAIFQAMRPVFNDLVSEIQRSVGYFSSVHRQSRIVKIIGMGNAFKLPGLQKFLAQNLQYAVEKVESFKHLKGDTVVTAPTFQENVLTFTVVYGLAVQGLELAGVRTSLLPPEIAQARMIRRKKPWALTAAAILLAGFTFLFLGNWRQLHAVSAPEFKPAEQRADSAKKLASDMASNFNKVKGEWNTIKGEGTTLTENVDRRLQWLEVLTVINSALPKNPANIDRTKLDELHEVQIEQISVSYHDDLKSEWFDKATNTPWGNITLSEMDKSQPPSGDGWVFTLRGYHFNKAGRTYTYNALLDDTGAAQSLQSPACREAGIKAAILVANNTDPSWSPWSDQRSRSRSGNRSGGGGGGMGSQSMTGGSSRSMGGMGGGGMGSQAGGGDEVSGGGGGQGYTGGGAGRRMMGSGAMMGGGGMMGGEGDPETPPSNDLFGMPPITNIPKTEFVIEFAWKRPDAASKKSAEEWLKLMQQAPRRVKRELPKDEPPPEPPAAPGQPAAQPGQGNVPPTGQPNQQLPSGTQQGLPQTPAAPGQGVPDPGLPGQGLPNQGAPQGTPNQGSPGPQGSPNTPPQGAPQGAPQGGMP